MAGISSISFCGLVITFSIRKSRCAMMSAFSLSKFPLCFVAMLTQMAFIMIGTTMIARQMTMIFMDFFRSFIGMGLDEDMLVCLATLQSYCLLSIFARGVDNLFGNKNLLYKNNWRIEVAKHYNLQSHRHFHCIKPRFSHRDFMVFLFA